MKKKTVKIYIKKLGKLSCSSQNFASVNQKNTALLIQYCKLSEIQNRFFWPNEKKPETLSLQTTALTSK